MDSKLAMKIYRVMCDVPSLEKDMVVGKGTKGEYKAIGEKTVLNAVKPLFIREKLIIFPSKTETVEVTETYVDGYGKNKLKSMTQSNMTYTLVDAETGESIDIEVTGNGADTQDKGSGKAATYAFKTALSKTFMMFTGDDTDNDHSDDTTKKFDKKLPAEPKYITDNEANLLAIKATEKKVSMKAILANYKINSLDKMTKEMLAHANKYLDSKEV